MVGNSWCDSVQGQQNQPKAILNLSIKSVFRLFAQNSCGFTGDVAMWGSSDCLRVTAASD